MPSPQQMIKEKFEELSKDINAFKEANDSRLKLIEGQKFAPADLEQKTDEINEKVDRSLQLVEDLQKEMKRLPETPTEADTKASKKFMRHKMRLEAVPEDVKTAYHKEWEQWFKEQGIDVKDMPREYQKALSVDTETEGGFFVRPTVSAEIMQKVYESSPLRQLADVMTISGDAFEMPADWADFSTSWNGEQTSRSVTATNAPFKELRIPLHSLEAYPRVTQKLLDDAMINIEALVADKVAGAFGRAEATAFISGNGISRPRGILTYTAETGTDTFGQIEQVNSGHASQLTGDGLIDLQNSLYEAFQSNARWLMRRASFGAIRKLKDGEGLYLFSVSGGRISDGQMGLDLLGRPVHFASDMEAVSAGNLPIAYGDFRSGYLIVDKLGIRMLRDPYTTKGQVEYFTTKRVGGGVKNSQAIKLQVVSA